VTTPATRRAYATAGTARNRAADNGDARIDVVVMNTNVDIHMSAVGRYEDDLVRRDGVWQIAKRRRIE